MQAQARKNLGGAFVTPLRYPGGKGRLGPWLADLMHFNGISGGWYVEPYAGGAGAALFLLMQGHVDHIIINDVDPAIYSFWRAVTGANESLLSMIRNTPITMDTWERQREVLLHPEDFDYLQVGFAAFFLNRTNRSGILSAGVIGGRAQAGKWKLDARYVSADLISRIAAIGLLAPRITVLGIDAVELLTDVGPGLPEECLVYLDPPYYVKGSQLYRNHYGPDDHAEIARCVASAEYPVVVTYDDCQEVRDLYRGLGEVNFSLHYSTHSARPLANEVLYYKNLELPSDPRMTRGFQLS
jgi:DNA adenine methylase